jgi:hypothetical protein
MKKNIYIYIILIYVILYILKKNILIINNNLYFDIKKK